MDDDEGDQTKIEQSLGYKDKPISKKKIYSDRPWLRRNGLLINDHRASILHEPPSNGIY